ncbi:MAG: glycosyltransferase [Phycisphaerae bacterium]|nr:glycosyltransferase [Gemmatimonadaceae bacterium]
MHILWLKTELLHPVDKGGRIRTYNMLRELCREHRVTYLTLDDGTAAPGAAELAREYSHELVRVPFQTAAKGSPRFFAELLRNVMSPLPYAVAKYESAEMRKSIIEHAARGADVIVCDFLFPSLNVPDSLGVPTVLFQHNVEAVIWERHMQIAESSVKKLYMRRQWQRMLRHEQAECRRFDHVIAVSDQDADAFTREYGVTSVSEVPTGVDTQYFQADVTVPRRRNNIAFTGSMDWLPNEDAIIWFTQSILPLVQARIPDSTFTIVGRKPTARILAMHGQNGIEVTGSVPDVRPYLNRAEVFVVPIRIGGGTRLKIYEAMAMGRAVVSTPVGAEGLPVVDGVHAMLRTEPQDLADAIVTVLSNPQQREAIERDSAALVREHYGWDGVARKFGDICQQVIDGPPGRKRRPQPVAS